MVHMTYVPVTAAGPESRRTYRSDPPLRFCSEVGPAARGTEEGIRFGAALVEDAEAIEATA